MTTTWIGSPNFTSGRQGTKVDRIVLHWIVGRLTAADATFQDRNRNTSAHYGIGGTQVHQYVKEENTAHHAGNWAMNLRSVGIEHEGGPNLPISDTTYQTSGKLVAEICQRYNIPLDVSHLILHKEIVATGCPGTLDRNRIIAEAKKASGSTQPVTPPTDNTKINDQTKIDLGPMVGVLEVQAIRSMLSDLRRDKANLAMALELAQHQREIKTNFINDQTKIYFGSELGYMEVQAVRSTLKDLRRDNRYLELMIEDSQTKVNQLKIQLGIRVNPS